MRRWMLIVGLAALALGASMAAPAADGVVYLPKAKVEAAKTHPGPMASGSDYIVIMSRRDEAGQSEVHAGETDVFYVLEGSATFVTGGRVVGGKTTAPGQIRGSGIEGGTSRKLSAGDVIIIPKGTPHWFKEVPKLVVYYVVKST